MVWKVENEQVLHLGRHNELIEVIILRNIVVREPKLILPKAIERIASTVE